MQINKLIGIIVVIAIVTILVFPFEYFFERYKTPEEAIRAYDLDAVIKKGNGINDYLVVTNEEKESKNSKNGKNIFALYYFSKDSRGWSKPKLSCFINDVKLSHVIMNRMNDSFAVIVFDNNQHKITDVAGIDFELTEINFAGEKIYAYMLFEFQKPDNPYIDIYVDGVKHNVAIPLDR